MSKTLRISFLASAAVALVAACQAVPPAGSSALALASAPRRGLVEPAVAGERPRADTAGQPELLAREAAWQIAPAAAGAHAQPATEQAAGGPTEGDGQQASPESEGAYLLAQAAGSQPPPAIGSAPTASAAADNPPPHETPAPAEPAGNNHANLAEAATNPLANLIQFQLQNQYNWSNHNSNGYSNEFLIQPIVPIPLPWQAVPLMITRTTVPYVTTPDLGPGAGRKSGLGDTTILAVVNPKLPKGNAGGVGVSAVFPTAGDNDFTGSGKWSAGPAYAYINTMVPHAQLGVLGWQHWSYADAQQHRESVNAHFIQPLAIWHFAEGWYAGLQDVPWKYNFKTNNWTMPTGPRVGKVLKIGKWPVNLFGQVYYDPFDDGANSRWTAKINLTLLFPE